MILRSQVAIEQGNIYFIFELQDQQKISYMTVGMMLDESTNTVGN